MHGIPVALLAGEFESEFKQCISMNDVCYVGTRSFEQPEMELLEK